jgi:1A family penicillin-binding protein
LGILAFLWYAKDLPDPQKISQRQIIESTKIYDRTGQIVFYDIHGEEKRTVVPFEEMPESIKKATIAIEDQNFYSHIGIDLKGIIRSALSNLESKTIRQGASTITQQFIKNAILSPERTWNRKIKEIVLSLELERRYSKDEILSFYLNQVPYGSNAYGIESASQTFFGKPAKDLTLAESALLASLTQATTYYSPYGSHFEDLKARQEYVLDRMNKLGYISQEQTEAAKKEELKFIMQREGLKAPHFVMYIKEYLEEKYGADYVEKAGLKVYTTLDWDLQKLAEEIVAKRAELNKKYRASNAALVAIDPKTGQVLAMVGSKDYFNIEKQGNFNVATSPHRQPGSSFKPFAYAMAFKKGYTPETIVFDLETNFGPMGDGTFYIPHNYDFKTRGPVTLKQSLSNSLNIPSVKVLYLAGINDTISLAEDMGITTLKDRKRYYLSLVLGGGEIKLIDEVAAYTVFAQEGVKHQMASILKIEDSKGTVLEQYEDKAQRIFDPQIARQISDILSDNEARSPIFGLNSPLKLNSRPAAAKTGTTQENRDGWTVGYTPSLVAGVWVGNNDNSPMIVGADGGIVAAPIWNEFMERAYEIKNSKDNQPINDFILPKNTESFTLPDPVSLDLKPILRGEVAFDHKVKIDKISKKLATDQTPPELIEEIIYKEAHNILYYVNKDDPQGPYPENPQNDPQFTAWEQPVLEWAQINGYNQQAPIDSDNIHNSQNQPKIKITSPQVGDYINQSSLFISAEIEAPLGVKQVDFFLNNNLIGTDNNFPFNITIDPQNYLNSDQDQVIKIVAYDKFLNRSEQEIIIRR